MVPLTMTVCDSEGLKIAADVLGRALERKANIAIWGHIGTGKTTLLRKIIDASKLQKNKMVYIDFDSIVNTVEDTPQYVVIDHPISPDSIEHAREKYPDVPLLAVLYEEPKDGFDIVIEMYMYP